MKTYVKMMPASMRDAYKAYKKAKKKSTKGTKGAFGGKKTNKVRR